MSQAVLECNFAVKIFEDAYFYSFQENSVLSLVAFTGAEGMLATASVTSNMVKLWNPPNADESIIRSPKHRISLSESEKCTVWR